FGVAGLGRLGKQILEEKTMKRGCVFLALMFAFAGVGQAAQQYRYTVYAGDVPAAVYVGPLIPSGSNALLSGWTVLYPGMLSGVLNTCQAFFIFPHWMVCESPSTAPPDYGQLRIYNFPWPTGPGSYVLASGYSQIYTYATDIYGNVIPGSGVFAYTDRL